MNILDGVIPKRKPPLVGRVTVQELPKAGAHILTILFFCSRFLLFHCLACKLYKTFRNKTPGLRHQKMIVASNPEPTLFTIPVTVIPHRNA